MSLVLNEELIQRKLSQHEEDDELKTDTKVYFRGKGSTHFSHDVGLNDSKEEPLMKDWRQAEPYSTYLTCASPRV